VPSQPEIKPETYISVDVETAGPTPEEYSMLSIGACRPRGRGALVAVQHEIEIERAVGAGQGRVVAGDDGSRLRRTAQTLWAHIRQQQRAGLRVGEEHLDVIRRTRRDEPVEFRTLESDADDRGDDVPHGGDRRPAQSERMTDGFSVERHRIQTRRARLPY
jgi:hypothetical protein